MKEIVKEKFFLVGVLLIAAAIAVGICNGCMHPKLKIVTSMEKGLQKENVKTLKNIIAPSVRAADGMLEEELKMMLALPKLESSFSWKDYLILQGKVIKDKDGKITGVETIQIVPVQGEINMNVNVLSLKEEDGKLYIADGLY